LKKNAAKNEAPRILVPYIGIIGIGIFAEPMTGGMPAGILIFFGLKPEGGSMNNLNSILIEGNLVRDPLYRTTAKGTPLCTFTVASNRYYKQDTGMEKEVGFFDVETWSKIAEHSYNLGKKGRGVRVVGRLRQDRWASADGKNHSKVSIVAEHVEFRPEFKKDTGPGSEDSIADEALAEISTAPIAGANETEEETVNTEEFEAVAF
jgi:single-strand DNA-binding protein